MRPAFQSWAMVQPLGKRSPERRACRGDSVWDDARLELSSIVTHGEPLPVAARKPRAEKFVSIEEIGDANHVSVDAPQPVDWLEGQHGAEQRAPEVQSGRRIDGLSLPASERCSTGSGHAAIIRTC